MLKIYLKKKKSYPGIKQLKEHFKATVNTLEKEFSGLFGSRLGKSSKNWVLNQTESIIKYDAVEHWGMKNDNMTMGAKPQKG